MPDGPKPFFELVVAEEMEKIKFQNFFVRLYLVGLLNSFAQSGGRNIFDIRQEPMVAITALNADHYELTTLGDRLLLSVGLFPEHFIARGKRAVSLEYYTAILKDVISRRLSREKRVWAEIHGNFGPTVTSLHGVRRRMKLNNADLSAIMDVYKATGEFLI